MDQAFIYETVQAEFITKTFSTEPLYAIIFLFLILILFVAISRKKKSIDDYSNAGYIESYDVLSQPIENFKHYQFPQNGVLFNNGSRVGILNSMLYSMLFVILFGMIVIFLSFSFGSHSCVII